MSELHTERLYLEDSYLREFTAKVLKVLRVDEKRVRVILDRTAFYPEGGGQPWDTGVIKGPSGQVHVDLVLDEGDYIRHEGDLEGEINEGDEVKGIIDWPRRYRLMRMHTAAHTLIYAVKSIMGPDVRVAGSSLDLDKSRVDFTARITRDMLPRLENEVNRIVEMGVPVKTFILPRSEAEKYLLRFHERLSEAHEGLKEIRIVEIEGLYACPCGGTHVKNTSELGYVKLLRRESKGRGITRIEFTVLRQPPR